MVRNAKVLGLALMAVIAANALAASVTTGASFDAPSGLTKITASQEANYEHTYTATFGATTCEKATFVGEASGNGLASVEVAPTYTGCLKGGLPAAVSMNECRYKLFAAGTVDIVCPAGKEITVIAPTGGIIKCTTHIPAQTGLKSATYTNLGTSPTKEVTVNVNISGIKYSQTEGSGLGKCATADNHTTGTYKGKALATGENSPGTIHTDILWTA